MVAEIQAVLAGVATTAAKAAMKKAPKGPLGDKILGTLGAMGGLGLSRDEIARKVKATATQVGVSLYHLTEKGPFRRTMTSISLRCQLLLKPQ